MSSFKQKRVGLIGYGTIGRRIANAAQERGFAKIDFVFSRKPIPPAHLPPGATALTDLQAVLERSVDLVVEAAAPQVITDFGLDLLRSGDLAAFSITALADDALRSQTEAVCLESGTRLFLPHGAILGLDGLRDGRTLIEQVTVTTTKHPRNLGFDDDRDLVLYDGPTREACRQFPRNVNVHAAIAIAGIGFDRTRSRIVADSSTKNMRHEIKVQGEGIEWSLSVASVAGSGVTGSYTPVSAASSVERILQGASGLVLA